MYRGGRRGNRDARHQVRDEGTSEKKEILKGGKKAKGMWLRSKSTGKGKGERKLFLLTRVSRGGGADFFSRGEEKTDEGRGQGRGLKRGGKGNTASPRKKLIHKARHKKKKSYESIKKGGGKSTLILKKGGY